MDLERIFEEQLKGFFLSKEEVSRFLADGDRVLQEKRDLLAERERIEAEKAKTYRLYIEDRITPEGFGDLYRPLKSGPANSPQRSPSFRRR